MNTKTSLILVGFFALSCVVTENSDGITGVYVREYSFEVVNPESGAKIGIRTVRDSIFIDAMNDRHKISNTKWRRNDYDMDGWQSMQHSDDRPMVDFNAVFDSRSGMFVPESDNGTYLYFVDDKLYTDKERKREYVKAR